MKKIRLVSVTICIITMLFACSTLIKNDKPYKALAMSKATAEEIVSVAKKMNNAGELSDKDLEKVRDMYEQARMANDFVINTLIISLNLGIDPRENINYNKAVDDFSNLLNDFMKLARELKLII